MVEWRISVLDRKPPSAVPALGISVLYSPLYSTTLGGKWVAEMWVPPTKRNKYEVPSDNGTKLYPDMTEHKQLFGGIHGFTSYASSPTCPIHTP